MGNMRGMEDDLRPRATVEVTCPCGISFWVDALCPGLPMTANAACARAKREFFDKHGHLPQSTEEMLEMAERSELYHRGQPILCPVCEPQPALKAV